MSQQLSGKPGALQFEEREARNECREGGSAAACRNLGLMLLDGETAQAGKPTADELFDRACDLGDVAAC